MDKEAQAGEFFVNGIVSNRDNQPYIQLANLNGIIVQLTMSQARAIADQIMLMAARTEADAMVLAFFKTINVPEHIPAVFMSQFRDFRMKLDEDKAEKSISSAITITASNIVSRFTLRILCCSV
jgi:hypothetical protein